MFGKEKVQPFIFIYVKPLKNIANEFNFKSKKEEKSSFPKKIYLIVHDNIFFIELSEKN